MPFVIPRITGYEEGRSFKLMGEQCVPTGQEMKDYIEWLEEELQLARERLQVMSYGSTLDASEDDKCETSGGSS